MTNNKIEVLSIIEKFGGIRPLASKLGITASTVQGWKKRNAIPDARLKAIKKIAKKEGIDLLSNDAVTAPKKPVEKSVKTDIKTEAKSEKKVVDNVENLKERSGQDRRQNDRRSGSRRETDHSVNSKKQQNQMKRDFLVRTGISFAFVFILMSLAGVALMLPEYISSKNRAEKVKSLEARLISMDERLEEFKKQKPAGVDKSFMSKINKLTEQAQNSQSAGELKARLARLEKTISSISTLEGNETIASLKGMLEGVQSDLSSLGETVQQTSVTKNDVLATAMLFGLGQFRDSLGREAPFQQDLAMMNKFFGSDPELAESLSRLSPYAEKGLMTKKALSDQFTGLATDIVKAKIDGQDLSLKEKVLSRLDNAVSVRKQGEVQGEDTKAIVARAQYHIDKGNMNQAVKELESLNGNAANVATPWINNAKGRLTADSLLSRLSSKVLSDVTSGNMSMGGIERMIKKSIRSTPLGIKGQSNSFPAQ